MKKTKDFINTVKVTGQTKLDLKVKAKGLQDRIFLFFRNHPGQGFTPHDVQKAFKKSLITSVRRSISNLTEAGYLIKTDMKVLEQHGVVNYKWIYNPNRTEPC